MKKIFLIIILLGIAFGVYYFLAQDKLNELVIENQKISYGGEEEKYTVEAGYPLISKGIPKKSAAIINDSVSKWTDRLAADANMNFAELAKDPVAVPEYATLSHASDYKINYDFGFAPYINIKFEIYSYNGGAHGTTAAKTFVFNAKTGKTIALEDMFTGSYLQKISAESFLEIKKIDPELKTYTFVEDGLKPIKENFSAWQILPEGFHITFGDYQVGPYATGRPEVTIPWENLSDVLKPEFISNLNFNR